MNICKGSTIYYYIFFILEIILLLLLIIFYIKYLYKYFINYNINKDNFEKFDILILFLSCFQIIIILITIIIKDIYLFDIFLIILKFTENIMIALLLIMILFWKNEIIIFFISNYFIISIIILDTCLFLISIFIKNPFEKNKNNDKTLLQIIVYLISFLMNIILIIFSLKKYNMNVNDYIDINFVNQFYKEKFKEYIDLNKYYLKIYLIILITFFLSFGIDILLTIIFCDNIIIKKNINNNNKNIYIDIKKENGNCDNNLYSNFYIKKLLICFFLFILRDFLPHLYIFLTFFIFKKQNVSSYINEPI